MQKSKENKSPIVRSNQNTNMLLNAHNSFMCWFRVLVSGKFNFSVNFFNGLKPSAIKYVNFGWGRKNGLLFFTLLMKRLLCSKTLLFTIVATYFLNGSVAINFASDTLRSRWFWSVKYLRMGSKPLSHEFSTTT